MENLNEYKTIKQLSDELKINASVIRKRLEELGMKDDLKKEKNSYLINENQEKLIRKSFGFCENETELSKDITNFEDTDINMTEEIIPFEENDFLDIENESIYEKKKKKFELPKLKRNENYQIEILGILIAIVAIMVVCVISISQIIHRSHIEDVEKMKSISQQIKHLETRIDSLEESLKLTDKDKLDINVKVNGNEEVSLTYDASTGKVENKDENGVVLDENFDTRPFLGVAFDTNKDANPLGLEVTYVYENSPAAFAGVKVGDIIISANNTVISKYEDLTAVIDPLKYGDKLILQVITIEDESITSKTLETTLTYRGNFDLGDSDKE